MLEGEWLLFCTCAAECGNVSGPYPKVIGTGPTVLTSTWSCAIGDGVPGGRSVRTPTLPRLGSTEIYGDLRGFMAMYGDVRRFTEIDVPLRLFGFG